MAITPPSLLSISLLHLVDEITMINESRCSWLHTDVMDGTFVPNFSFGFPIIETICPICQKPLNVHLMIVESWRFIDQLAKLDTHTTGVHYEVYPHLYRMLRIVREAGMCSAVALDPHTSAEFLTDIPCEADAVPLISVNPGYGGQRSIGHSACKIKRLRKTIQEQGLSTPIQVDGGANLETGRQLVEAGADSLVISSAIFKASGPQEMTVQLYILQAIPHCLVRGPHVTIMCPALVTFLSLMLGICLGNPGLLAAQRYLPGTVVATLLSAPSRPWHRALPAGSARYLVFLCMGTYLATIPWERVA